MSLNPPSEKWPKLAPLFDQRPPDLWVPRALLSSRTLGSFPYSELSGHLTTTSSGGNGTSPWSTALEEPALVFVREDIQMCWTINRTGRNNACFHSSQLEHGFPLIPSKLVSKIQHLECVSMADLLPNMWNLLNARWNRNKAVSKGACWHGLCTWPFVAVAVRKHPAKVHELLTYRAKRMMEALSFGYFSYDKIFREDSSTYRSILHPMF